MDGMTPMHHAISEGHGEAALVLLRAGADATKRDGDGKLAIDLAPDSKVIIAENRALVLKAP
jgi:26S proteasome non-ATPase regulatory subunit 10